MGLASEIEAAIDVLLNTFVTSKSAALCGILTPVALTAATLYIVIIGYAVARGEANDPIQTALWKFVKMAFVGTFALGVGSYQGQLLQGFYGIQEGLIGAFSNATTVGGVIDQFMVPYDALSAAIGQEASTSVVPNLALYFAMAVVVIAEVWIFAIGIGMYLLAKVALALVLAVGPAFILCAMFPATQRFTESWIGQVINYLLLSVLVVASFTMLTLFAQSFAAKALQNYSSDSAIIKDCVALLIISVSLGVVMLNLNAIAGALGGGAAISGHGAMGRATAGTALAAGLIGGAIWAFSQLGKSDNANSISEGSGPKSDDASSASIPLCQRNVIDNISKSN